MNTQAPAENADHGTVLAYQGMKLSQALDRLTQLEHIVMKIANTSSENTKKIIEELTILKGHTGYVPPGALVSQPPNLTNENVSVEASV
jgi:hypothetical protein